MRHRVDRDLDGLNRGRVRRGAEFASDPRDLPRELDIALGQAEPIVSDGDHPNGDTVVPHVNVRVARAEAVEIADRLRQTRARREGPGPEVRTRAVVQHPPVFDAVGLEELRRRDPLAHPPKRSRVRLR
jgi:hypothetical protein